MHSAAAGDSRRGRTLGKKWRLGSPADSEDGGRTNPGAVAKDGRTLRLTTKTAADVDYRTRGHADCRKGHSRHPGEERTTSAGTRTRTRSLYIVKRQAAPLEEHQAEHQKTAGSCRSEISAPQKFPRGSPEVRAPCLVKLGSESIKSTGLSGLNKTAKVSSLGVV